jgi:hypothetical protein
MLKRVVMIGAVSATWLAGVGLAAAPAELPRTTILGVVQRRDGTWVRRAPVHVSALMPPTFSLLPSTRDLFLTRTITDHRGRFRVSVTPPKAARGFNIMVFDTARKKTTNGTAVSYRPSHAFPVAAGKLNVLVVPEPIR